jgi:hypothetical protein
VRAEELKVIADPTVHPTRFAEAVRRLGRANEPPSFWTAIANDPTYPLAHRRTAVLQLFMRHVAPGTPLAQLVRILDGAPWLEDEDVALVEDIGGFAGLTTGLGDIAFRITVLPDSDAGAFVFLALDATLDRLAFAATVRGGGIAPDARIVDRATLPLDGVDAG